MSDIILTTAEKDIYTPQEMAARLNDMKIKLNLIQEFFKNIMVENQDYGVIPGTDRPTLMKSGAEKLCELYGYAITIKDLKETIEQEIGYYRAIVTVALVSKRSGEIVAEGVGEANTMEGRYRWRWVPEWKVPKGLDKSTLHYEERKDKNGNSYKTYRVPNEDPWALWNTVLKMAKKRALVDATLSATRSSGIFTQDMEDLREWVDGDVYQERFREANGVRHEELKIPRPKPKKKDGEAKEINWTGFWRNIKGILKLKEKDVEELASKYLQKEVKLAQLSVLFTTQEDVDALYQFIATETAAPEATEEGMKP